MSLNGKQSRAQKIQWRKPNLVNPLATPYTFEQQVLSSGHTSGTAPADTLVQYLSGQIFQVSGTVQVASGSVIQSPKVQDEQCYTTVECAYSQESVDSVTDHQKGRGILSQRPSNRKSHNLLLDMPAVPCIKEEKIQDDTRVAAATVPITSRGQNIANTQDEAVHLDDNCTNWVQGIQTLTMANLEAALQSRAMIQNAQTNSVHRKQVLVQDASDEVQTHQSRTTPASSTAPNMVKAAPALPTQSATEKVTCKRKIHLKNSERQHMDSLFEGAKKSKGKGPVMDPRPPPAKLTLLKQNNAKPLAQDRIQRSPVAKDQGKNWHSSLSLLPVFCVVEHGQNQLNRGRRKVHAEFVLVKKDLLFNQLIEMALLAIGYSHIFATQAKGLIQIGRWNPLPLSSITDAPDATVADMLQDIHHVITLKIQLHSCPKLEDLPPEQWTHFTVRKALKYLLKDMSQSCLAQKYPLSQSTISSIKNCAYQSNVSAAKCHQFGRWYRLFKKTKCIKEIDSFPQQSAYVTLNKHPITGSIPEQSSTVLCPQREAYICAPSPCSLYPSGQVIQPLSSEMDNQQLFMTQLLNQPHAVSPVLAGQSLSPTPQQHLSYRSIIAPAEVFSKAPDSQAQQLQWRVEGGPAACAPNQTMAGFSEGYYDVPSNTYQCVNKEYKSPGIPQAISSRAAFNSSHNMQSEILHVDEDQKHLCTDMYTWMQLLENMDHIYQE